jgi:hypothetical protein
MKRLAIIAVVLVLLHLVLAAVMARADFMAALAGARHGHVATALGFALLLAVRFVTLVIVPPLVVAGLGVRLVGRLARR